MAFVLGCGAALADPRAEPGCPPPPAPPSAAQLQVAQREARDRGLLWRISKQGRVSYLFGTIHVGKWPWSLPGPQLSRALAQTDLLALELDPTDPGVARQLQAAQQTAAVDLPVALRQRLQAQIESACLPADALRGVHPVLQALTLTLLAARQESLDAAYAQEPMLAALAHAAGRPIVSLETVDRQLGALLPADPAQTQALLEDALDQLERGRAAPTLRRLAEAWASGDLATLEQYAQWCECADSEAQRALLHRLNDARNAHLAQRVDALHGQGQRVFVAVGALHMTGPQALPTLLAQRGFEVQRVEFD
jgi:uncharacterized protein YbaP (TraB family)